MPHPIDHIKSYIDLTPEIENAILSIMEEKTFRRGDKISTLTEIRDYTFYITMGSARVYYLSSGKDHTYSFAFDDEFITIPRRPMSNPDLFMSIEFLEKTEVILIPHLTMHNIMNKYNMEHIEGAQLLLITALYELTNDLEERVIMFQTASATERYRWVMKRYPHLLERATITQVASFLGITKETLYRIRSDNY